MDSAIGEPIRVLAVDDDPAALRLVAKIMSSAGYEVTAVDSGKRAIELIRSTCPDILVCDWEMPEMDGLELCRTIRQEKLPQYLFILLLTARSLTEDMIEGLSSGADDYLPKPIHRASLLARLQAASRLVEMERELRQLSHFDPLTGVPNRRTFHERLAQEWERSNRFSHPLACVMIDLDFFKWINDTHGHAAGDETLKAVAQSLDGLLRESDILCRFGGEEFCVLLPETDENGAAAWADRARGTIADQVVIMGSKEIQVTGSFGVSERLDDTANPERLVSQADQALGVAKQSGRNCIVRFNSLNDPLVDLSDDTRFANPLNGAVARDVMTAAVFCPNRSDQVKYVSDLLLQLRLDSAPIVDDEERLVGLVSVTDLMTFTAAGDGWDQRIDGVMKTRVVCYEENTSAQTVFQFLARTSIRCVVVVDQGRPVGTISRSSFLRWFQNWVSIDSARRADAVNGTLRESPADEIAASLVMIAKAAARHEALLPRCLEQRCDDIVPYVVGEATRLQELANDLLAHCRRVPLSAMIFGADGDV